MRRPIKDTSEGGALAGAPSSSEGSEKGPRSRPARTLVVVLVVASFVLVAAWSPAGIPQAQPVPVTTLSLAEASRVSVDTGGVVGQAISPPSHLVASTGTEIGVGAVTRADGGATTSATPPRKPARVGLLMLVVGATFPSWWPFLVASYVRSHPTYELIVVHTGECASCASTAPHIRFVHLPLATLAGRFVEKLGVAARRVDDKFASAKGLSDLKPFYGHIFDDLIPEQTYTHWGWADWDLLIGDLPAVVGEDALWEYDALTFPGATLGFAWAGQLSIFRNLAESRTLFRVVDSHVDLGFKVGSSEAADSNPNPDRDLDPHCDPHRDPRCDPIPRF